MFLVKQVRMYCGSGTVDGSASGKLADTAAYAPGRRCMCNHQMAALLFVKWRHSRHHESLTSNRKSDHLSIDLSLLDEQSCQISTRSDLKWRSFRLFWWRSAQTRTRTR